MKFDENITVYGDLSFRGKCPKERIEQVTFFNRIRTRGGPGLLAIHPKNEGKKTIQQAIMDRAEGLTTGASDVIIPASPSFVCEIKRRDHTQSNWQDGQEKYLLLAKSLGAFACVALGADAAIEAYDEWLTFLTNL